jgi:tetratricopeptide (TPR) repeat protein
MDIPEIDSAVGSIIERRHRTLLDGYNRFVRDHVPRLRADAPLESLAELDLEYRNIAGILDGFSSTGERTCLSLFMELATYLTVRGYATEEIRWGSALLRAGMPEDVDSPEMDAFLLNNIGLLSNIAGAYDELGDAETAVHFYTYITSMVSPQPSLSIVYSNLGVSYRRLGQYEQALEYTELAIRYEREANDRRGLALSLMNLSSIYYAQFLMKEAMAAIEESLALATELGNLLVLAQVTGQYAMVTVGNLRLDEAVPIYERALELYDSIPDPIGFARAAFNYALLQYALKREAQAIPMAQEALRVLEPYGFPEAERMRITLDKWIEKHQEYEAWVR